jgi:chromosome segregation ATPase
MMMAAEERYKRQITKTQEKMSTYNEQGRGDSKGAEKAERRIAKLQTALEELQAKRQSMGAPIIANETVNNSTSSSIATYGDTSPATDDLDRVA